MDLRYPFPDRTFPVAVRRGGPSTVLNLPLSNSAQFVFLESGSLRMIRKGSSSVLCAPGILRISTRAKEIFKPSDDVTITRILFGRVFVDRVLANSYCTEELRVPGFDENAKGSDYIEIGSEMRTLSLLIRDMENELSERGSLYQLVVQSSFISLLVLLYRIRHPGESSATIKPPIVPGKLDINQVVSLMNSDYAGAHSLQSLAMQFSVNPSYLSRKFKERTGTALFEYLNRIRIQKACILLKRSDMSILEIALSVGYNSVSFFNRYFRRLMNQSPGEYRKITRD